MPSPLRNGDIPTRYNIHDLPLPSAGSSFALVGRLFGRLEDDKTGLLLFSFNTTEGGSSTMHEIKIQKRDELKGDERSGE